MTHTSSKLNEAKFFNKLLKDHYLKYPDFNYYLNAFLSSSRAVTWVMNSEYDKTKGYHEWFENEKPSDEIHGLLKKINDLRIQTNKIKPVRANPNALFTIDETTITDEIREQLIKIDKKKVSITLSVASAASDEKSNDEITFKGKIENVFNSVDEFPDENILEVCEKYVEELERVVLECEKRFKHLLPETKYKGLTINFTNGDVLK
ncbi:hypothetical protein [Mangrovibacillus cuniculi]|uniref:Uncharacterized protein n=1 Tax=Mangrovibacillus cuniculi TaxID=2593652 RepID=A0A7S8CCU6_9BACI|nr:hypothetical protein [Mangrovibacillus cuniculi]QPC47562.1 hypothetical protein G8O30_11675 [Mangrovibacillus cuniculi]